jgi:hypothetical protein
VEQGVLAGKLDSDCADNLAVGIFYDLKFGQAFFQFVRRQPHGRPKQFERVAVIHGGAADAERLRIHDSLPACICILKIMWQLQPEIKLKTKHEQHYKRTTSRGFELALRNESF